ncbi:velvet factor-domain-containing protein [Phanerochaete sordida]|uniref:Velvet factor-domain-containing protein n=1 Tax=Phanerochaete sordida TaxID=48140 RepID=A0A9P3GAM9_9APHY|nr:velvet factor-domain-containing protein [Phanerochaete sordida]
MAAELLCSRAAPTVRRTTCTVSRRRCRLWALQRVTKEDVRHAAAARPRRVHKHSCVCRLALGHRARWIEIRRPKLLRRARSGISQRHASDPSDPRQQFVYPRHQGHGRTPDIRSDNVWQGSPSPSLTGSSPYVLFGSESSSRQSSAYSLQVVQHPSKAAEFGSSTLTRLAVAPPLIAQLFFHGRANPDDFDDSELPFLIAHLSLYSADGSTALDVVGPGGQTPSRQLLYGNLVSSPQTLRNLQGRQGMYFLFPDVSIRNRGRFQLHVTLMRIPRASSGGALSVAGQGVMLARARSMPFDVYSRAEYVAPAQTPLTQYFMQQGVRMTVSCLQRP